MARFYVYIMSDAEQTAVLTGVTSTVHAHVWQYKQQATASGSTATKVLDRLVHYEQFSDPNAAVDREEELRGWETTQQITLIESTNPDWSDLSEGWFDRATCE